MKTIPERFVKNGWHYRLVKRTERGAIYSQSWFPNSQPSAFEVVRVRTRAGRTITTKTGSYEIEAGEYLPSTEEWGEQGWTIHSLPDAEDRLNQISHTPQTKRPLARIRKGLEP